MAAESLEDALKQLYLIDAIDENGSITKIGQTMAGTTLNIYHYLCTLFYAYDCSRITILYLRCGCLSKLMTLCSC